MMSEPQASLDEPLSLESQTPRKRFVRIAMRIGFFLVCYVLSIGPMFWQWYESEHMGGSPLVRVFYAPLRLLCEIPAFESLLNRYINWWVA